MSQRILILRPDGIGDCVIFSGALKWIRRHWLDATIDLMVQPHVRELFELCPHVDHVLSTGRLAPWEGLRQRDARGSWRLEKLLLSDILRKLWYPRYDVVIYPVSAAVENWLKAVRLMDAKEKWGYGGEQLRIAKLEDERNSPDQVFTAMFRNTEDNRWLHESNRSLEFLREMNVHADDMKPELWLSEDDRQFARRVIPENSLGFFVGAGSPWRQWPADKWRDLAARQEGHQVIAVLGASADAVYAQTLRVGHEASALQVVDLTGATSLRQLAACVSRCSTLVSNDSAGLHFAVAAGVPAVGIMGGYHFGRFYPWGDENIHRTANLRMDCYHCNDDCIYNDWRCVSDISVETVLSELQTINPEPGTRHPEPRTRHPEPRTRHPEP
jgi:ADP-heptose:LPS heptosyltransferase